jgi:hypothetical protein
MAKKIIPVMLMAAILLGSTYSFAIPRAKLRNKKPRSTVGVMRSPARPVVTLHDHTVGSLELLFGASVGSVSVAVEGEAGEAYYEEWQVTAGEQRSISTEEWELGMYALTVTLSNGAAYVWELELVEE